MNRVDQTSTQSGMFVAPEHEVTVSLDPISGQSAGSGDETTRAIDVVPTSGRRLETTGSLELPSVQFASPEAGEIIAGRYRLDARWPSPDGVHLFKGASNEGAVVLRFYADPHAVRGRSAWQVLREAFEGGAALPELLRASGVIPLVDLIDDPRFGPVVVTALPAGQTLAEAGPSLPVNRLAAIFERVASVLMLAHAHGVALGRFDATDVRLDEYGAPHLDLTVAAFGDALDPFGAQSTENPSPAGDVVWLGRVMRSCLPSSHEPGADVIAAIAQECLERQPPPTAADVFHRMKAIRPLGPQTPLPALAAPQLRWPAGLLLVAGTLVALGAGWIAGGGLSSPSTEVVVPAGAEATLATARAAIEKGALLDAGQIYRHAMAERDDPRIAAAWESLRKQRAFRRALKDLKKRLATARALTPAVRRDVDMLRVLQPESLVLEHWLGRMAEQDGGGR